MWLHISQQISIAEIRNSQRQIDRRTDIEKGKRKFVERRKGNDTLVPQANYVMR